MNEITSTIAGMLFIAALILFYFFYVKPNQDDKALKKEEKKGYPRTVELLAKLPLATARQVITAWKL